jgi:hypothetical protein
VFPQRIRSINVFNCAMRRFAAELAFDALDKRQTPDGDRFRPAIVSPCPLRQKRLLHPLAMGSLKISQLRKAV